MQIKALVLRQVYSFWAPILIVRFCSLWLNLNVICWEGILSFSNHEFFLFLGPSIINDYIILQIICKIYSRAYLKKPICSLFDVEEYFRTIFLNIICQKFHPPFATKLHFIKCSILFQHIGRKYLRHKIVVIN